jgi:hypothetical protein
VAKCHVTFVTSKQRGGPSAILWDRHGHALNAMNYPRDHRFTAKEKARARKSLMKGCAEFSRDYAKHGNVSTETMAKHRGLVGAKREPPPIYHPRQGPPPGVPVLKGRRTRKRRR